MSTTTVIQPSQLKLAHAIIVLRQWQAEMDAHHENRHGLCLLSVRHALAEVGLSLPPPQPKPNNVALWCGHELVRQPDRFGWERVTPPFHAKLSLDFFSACGKLPDGRTAGHVALVDHEARILYSAVDYGMDAYWLQRRFASFVPAP